MFWVRDTRQERAARIRKFLSDNEAPIAVLLAAANLEWTLRRAITLLSELPIDAARDALQGCSGLQGYKLIWKKLVVPHHRDDLSEVIKNWNDLNGEKGKYQLRHNLIHGTVGLCGRKFAEPHVEALLAAAKDVDDYCMARKKNVYRKLTAPRTKAS